MKPSGCEAAWSDHLSIFYYNAIWEYQQNFFVLLPSGKNTIIEIKHSESIPFPIFVPSELYSKKN